MNDNKTFEREERYIVYWNTATGELSKSFNDFAEAEIFYKGIKRLTKDCYMTVKIL